MLSRGDGDTGGSGADDEVASGESLFATSCAACHGPDGGSGFAPDVRGASFEVLDAEVRDPGSTHAGGTFPDLTDQDITDMAAFLGS